MICGTEISDLCGVGRPAVSNWRVRYADFPKPVYQYGDVKVYDRAEMFVWLAINGKFR